MRTTGGRLVPVKKNAALLGDPLKLWVALFEVFPRVGEAFLPSGFAESLLRREFTDGIGTVLTVLYGRDGAVPIAELYATAWDVVTAPYVLDDATEEQLRHGRAMNDRDTKRALDVLQRLGAVTLDKESVELTELGRYGMGRILGDPEPGEHIYQVKITLLEVGNPPVWRRVLVPAAIRLGRFHQVIQAAMGWEDCHLHMFIDGPEYYGFPDPELRHRDEREVRLSKLATEGDRIRYIYDFGDDWEHEILVEEVTVAEPGVHYPRCIAGLGTCPPEGCGGWPGYERIREILADTGHDEHEDMITWLGLAEAVDFDPSRFDLGETNQRLAEKTKR